MVKGFKVFNSDWQCRGKQYTCPGKFEEDVDLDICSSGMHFCKVAANCFNYYDFDPNNKVAEVIAYGDVIENGDKCCTNKLEIVREIPWAELLQIVNTGDSCTGLSNTGCWNTGCWNSGHRNTGNRNTGNRNTGDWNTGSWNTGHWNSGHCNTGSWNTGSHNIGNWNTGDWNKSSFNNGCFMTIESKIMMFNKPSDWTYQRWLSSTAKFLLNQIPNNVTRWVHDYQMTDKEKRKHPEYKIVGGYLKVLDENNCAQTWWNELSQVEKNTILALPNFDPEIFKECTGIDINYTEEEVE